MPATGPVSASAALVDEWLNATIREVGAAARTARNGDLYWCLPAGPVSPLPAPIYAGTLGVAVFLAAAARVSGVGAARELCLRAIAPLRRDLDGIGNDPARKSAIHLPVGGLAGLGSIVYALACIADLLELPALADEALATSRLLDPERIAGDEHLDVMIGSAGALLALLALEHHRLPGGAPHLGPIAATSRCAFRILEAHPRLARPPRGASRGLEQGPSGPGFCHGTAGIVTALLRLFRRTGDPALVTAARRLLRPEHAPRGRRPPSGRQPRDPAADATSWCKGSAGIALGQIEAQAALGASLHAVEAALAATAAAPLGPNDDLCCGNAGRIDVLVHAAEALASPAHLASAHRLAGAMLARAQERGRLTLPLAAERTDVRLFPGLAGVGYCLARLKAPGQVPCVPALEPARGPWAAALAMPHAPS